MELNRGMATYGKTRLKAEKFTYDKKNRFNIFNEMAECKFDRVFGNNRKKCNPLKPLHRSPACSLEPLYRPSDESESSPECSKSTTKLTVQLQSIERQLSPDAIKLFDSNEELAPLKSLRNKRKTLHDVKSAKKNANFYNNNTATSHRVTSTLIKDRKEFLTPDKFVCKAPIQPNQYSTPCNYVDDRVSGGNKRAQFPALFSPIAKPKSNQTLVQSPCKTTPSIHLVKTPPLNLSQLSDNQLAADDSETQPDPLALTALSVPEVDSSVRSSPATPVNHCRQSTRLSIANNSLRLLAEQFLQRSSDLGDKIGDPNLSARAKLLMLCDPPKMQPFSSALSKSLLQSCRKIAEGSYGEIYRADESNGGSVIKIVPVLNNEFDKLLPEVFVSLAFNQLQERCENFIRTTSCKCVSGRYPKSLENEWHRYDREHRSQNEFPGGRQHLLFTLDHGGECLEQFAFETIEQAVSVFEQVMCSLAMAERALSFEHRDLHWGNVLIAPEAQSEFVYRLGDRKLRVPTHGIHCRLIDFSLSRSSIGSHVFFHNLSNEPTLFAGKGDPQFDIYRQMRTICNDQWQQFNPETNVLWLHYLADKLILKSRGLRRRGAVEAGRRLRLYAATVGKHKSAEQAMLSLLN